jgi:hypothetical protein
MPGVNLPRILDQLERDGRRYVSDGRPGRATAGN